MRGLLHQISRVFPHSRRYGFRALLLGAVMSMLFAGLAFAYEKDDKPIRSVSFSITGYIQIDTKPGEEELEIHTNGNKYDYDYYEVMNDTFMWTLEDTPVLKVYLQAEEGYYFRITKASEIKINGGTYVSASRENNAYTLAVEVRLPSLDTQVAPIEKAIMEGGVCTWTESEGAKAYEVKFMRNGTTLGGNQIVEGLTYDGTKYMTKSANYHFKVRAINKKDESIRGHWVDSNTVYVTEEQARAQRDANEEEDSRGRWEQTEQGWKFYPDGEELPVKDKWRQIKDKWYLFDENGYMRTGWYLDGDKWYYLDEQEGYLWRNAVTPDGYEVGIDGVMSTGIEMKKPGEW